MQKLRTILLVEDDPDTHMLAKATLRFKGFAVVSTFRGEEAIELARKKLPDLIILNAGLHGTDGYEVLRGLKADPGTSSIPVALLSTKVHRDEEERGLSLGAARYLVKPLDPLAFASAVQEILSDQ